MAYPTYGGPTGVYSYQPRYGRRKPRNPANTLPNDRRGMTLGAGPTAGSVLPRTTPRPAPGPRVGAGGGGGLPPAPVLPGLASDSDLMAQASALAQGQIDPILKNLADLINRRGQEGAAAISGLTGQYAAALGQYAAALPGIYEPAKAEIAGTTQALADRLKGEGKGAGQDLAQVIEQAGQTDTSGIDLGKIGKGAGNAAYGTGIADLDALIARQAAAQTEAAMEPGFAYAGGQQELGLFQRDLARMLAERTGDITSQVPGLVQSIYQTLYGNRRDEQDERTRQRERAEDIGLHTRERGQDLALRNRERGQDLRSDALTRNAALARDRTTDTGELWTYTRDGIRPVDGDPKRPGIQRVKTIDRQVAESQSWIEEQKSRQPDATLSRAYGYIVDSNGNEILRDGKRVPVAKTPPKAAAPPKVDVTLSKQIGQWVDGRGNPVPALQGRPVPKPKKDEAKVDLDLSITMGEYVDSAGRPIPSLAGRKPPKAKPGTGSGKGGSAPPPRYGWQAPG